MIKWPALNRKQRRHPGLFIEDQGIVSYPIYLGINKFKRDNPEASKKEIREYKNKQWRTYNEEVKDEQPKDVHISKPGTRNVHGKGSSSGGSLRDAHVETDTGTGVISLMGEESDKDSPSSKGRKSPENS